MGAVALLAVIHLLLIATFTAGVRPYEREQAEAVIATECVGEDDLPCFCQCPEECEDGSLVDECRSAPCLHDGDCIDGVHDYTCDCSQVYPWGGRNCEINQQCLTHEATVKSECFNDLAVVSSNLPPAGLCTSACTSAINQFYAAECLLESTSDGSEHQQTYDDLHNLCAQQPMCTGATVQDRFKRMAKVCCPGDETCSAAATAPTCSAACVPEFDLFMRECGTWVQQQPALATKLQQFSGVCHGVPTPPPADEDLCDDGTSFTTLSQRVFAACCPDNKTCNPLPDACSEECAGQFPNFMGTCEKQIQALPTASALASFLQVCQNPAPPPVPPPPPPPPPVPPPPPPADEDLCDDGTSFTTLSQRVFAACCPDNKTCNPL
eukprot:COSAG02_NODE_3188_length_7205_cov_25.313538_1_plen_379_part_10